MVIKAIAGIGALFPEVKRPSKAPTLNEKLLWTAAILLLFYIMGQIYPVGVDMAKVSTQYLRLEMLLGSKLGTLITIGIGPIVLASIFLQLAVGAGIMNLDLRSTEGKKQFQDLQKVFIVILAVIESFVYVQSGYVPVLGSGAALFMGITVTHLLVIAQIALGSIMLMYLDEVVQKWGIGSGISLFIAAGVCQAVFIGAFNFLVPPGGTEPAGLIPRALLYISTGNVPAAVWTIIPLVFTIAVFVLVVYIEGMKIELPLSYGQAKGIGARYPIKFLYVSNMPVILAFAVIMNVQIFGAFLSGNGIYLLGTFQGGQPVDGLAYFITSPPNPVLLPGGYQSYLALMSTPREIFHMITYGISLVILCVVFGWFWIESTGMSPKQIAEQLSSAGLQIPGFRRDPRIIEKVLEKYIPIITILGSIAVGLLAWFADITGALGTGTGILLTVGIIYRFYEQLMREQLMEQYPMLKKFV